MVCALGSRRLFVIVSKHNGEAFLFNVSENVVKTGDFRQQKAQKFAKNVKLFINLQKLTYKIENVDTRRVHLLGQSGRKQKTNS